MQIHELTLKKPTELDEGFGDDIGGAAGGAVNMVKNVGSAIASPFKDVAQGYKSARQDQKVSAMADKAFRVWQSYVAQVEQSIAKQPAPAAVVAPAKTDPKNIPPADGAAAAATKDAAAPGATTPPPAAGATTPPANGATPQSADATARGEQNKGFGFNRNTGVAFNSQAEKDAVKAQAGNASSATTPAKPNYGAQTGAGANVTYKQPTGVPNPLANTIQPTSKNISQPPAKATTQQTGAVSDPNWRQDALKSVGADIKEIKTKTLKELQAPAAAVSPALTAFRDRSDGKYEQYLTAFVQKNLLAGMGFKGLVNQGEISNAIKAIAAPANADPAKQRPLWNDLVRACALAMPSQGALTGRTGGKDKDPNATGTPGEEKPGEEKPAAPTMTKDQISQWITRNSEDHAALSALLAAINSAGKA